MIRPFFCVAVIPGRCEASNYGAQSTRRLGRSQRIVAYAACLLRREPAVEGLALRRHVAQQLAAASKRGPYFACELVAQLDEGLRAHAVDVGERAAGERREAEAEDRADIGLARIGDDALLHACARLPPPAPTRKRCFSSSTSSVSGSSCFGLQVREARPQALLALALLGIVVEALAVLAAEAALLLDHASTSSCFCAGSTALAPRSASVALQDLAARGRARLRR